MYKKNNFLHTGYTLSLSTPADDKRPASRNFFLSINLLLSFSPLLLLFSNSIERMNVHTHTHTLQLLLCVILCTPIDDKPACLSYMRWCSFWQVSCFLLMMSYFFSLKKNVKISCPQCPQWFYLRFHIVISYSNNIMFIVKFAFKGKCCDIR